MRSGKPTATEAELRCGSRKTREANAARAKAQGKPRNQGASASVDNPADTGTCFRARKGAHAGLVGL